MTIDLPTTLHMTIDPSAIADNISILRSMIAPSCELSAVVKANAYGLGIQNVAPVMMDCGIELYFTANLSEAVQLRRLLGPKPRIAVFGGFHEDHAAWTDDHIIPVLCGLNDIKQWRGRAASFLQVDTGMNRLGIRYDALDTLPLEYKPDLVMSHFANADIRNDPMNNIQYQRFKEALADKLKDVPRSLCNSAGVFSDKEYHLDVVRCGKAIYGAAIFDDGPNPMKQTLTLSARILAVNEVKAGETCGYGATYTFPENAVTATVGVGYADGLSRALSNIGQFYWDGKACPIRGRVSMDLTTVDITHLAKRPKVGDWLEILGPQQSELDMASMIGTNTYEITTSFGTGNRHVTSLASTRTVPARKTGT